MAKGMQAIWVPLLGVLAVCLIGPCNGSTYMRYLYPVIACMPFAIGAAVTRSDFLWSKLGALWPGFFAPKGASSRRLHFGVYLAG